MISTRKNFNTGIIPPLKLPRLFHQMGGYPLLEEAVDLLYERLLADQRINYFFGSNDMKLQRAQMKSFLGKSLGVSAGYTNFKMDNVSSPFRKSGMTVDHFVIVMNQLRQSYLDLGVDANLVDEAMVCVISSSKETSN